MAVLSSDFNILSYALGGWDEVDGGRCDLLIERTFRHVLSNSHRYSPVAGSRSALFSPSMLVRDDVAERFIGFNLKFPPTKN